MWNLNISFHVGEFNFLRAHQRGTKRIFFLVARFNHLRLTWNIWIDLNLKMNYRTGREGGVTASCLLDCAMVKSRHPIWAENVVIHWVTYNQSKDLKISFKTSQVVVKTCQITGSVLKFRGHSELLASSRRGFICEKESGQWAGHLQSLAERKTQEFRQKPKDSFHFHRALHNNDVTVLHLFSFARNHLCPKSRGRFTNVLFDDCY